MSPPREAVLKGLGPENVQAFYKEHGGSAGACQVACAASESAEAFHSNAADAHRNGKLWGDAPGSVR